MDDKRFDALTRALAGGASRRSVLKGLLGGAGALAGSAVVRQSASAQTCLDPPEDICPGGGGTNGDGCPCNSGAGICDGDWCVECRIGSDDDCLVTQGAGLCNDSGTNLCECVQGSQGPVCQLLPTTTTTVDPCPSDFFCGDECCPTVADYTCCGGSSCCPNERCNNETNVCCPEGQFPCGTGCCDVADNCCGGVCCAGSQCNQAVEPQVCCDEGTFPCGTTESNVCCDNAENCCNGVCCPSGQCNQAVEPQVCCAEGEFACGTTEGNICCDTASETCTNDLCCPTTGTACTAAGGDIPDGCPCGEGATCHGGWCCSDWQICGDVCCEGDEECISCIDGACTFINQMGDCNGGPLEGGGVCCDQYCLTLEECCPPFEGDSCTADGGTIPDRCPCGEGATCHGGWCCHDWQICGDVCCEGDDECISCDNGTCILINQYGSCNEGAGVCCDQYCIEPENCCPEGGCRNCETCWNGTCIEDCPDCESCNDEGSCESDCNPGACETYTSCVNGTCMFEGCSEEEYCCGINGDSYCANLETDRWNCGDCGIECDSCEVCLNGSCIETEECCGTFGDACGDPVLPADARQLDCCDGLLCCHGEPRTSDGDDDDDDDVVPLGESMYCAECCNDHHCGKGYHCCHGQCIRDEYCCSDHDCDECEECRYIDGYGFGYCELTGVPFGEYCGYVITTEGGSPQLDCCDGLVCCDVDKDGNRCFECCGDWDCPKGSECKHGVCEHECKHDKECPDGTCCCKSGHCSKHCCKDRPHKHGKKPDDDKGGPAVDTLPSTGSGDTAAGAGWLGAAALGAAAYVVGKTVRDGAQPEAEAQPEE